ncbi:MAG: transposase [Exilibacterium sp.]
MLCAPKSQTLWVYTDEFKKNAVKLVLEQRYKVSEAARNLGVNDGVLRRWINKFTETEKRDPGSSGELAAAQACICELETENKRLQMEREILKNRPPVPTYHRIETHRATMLS